MNVAGGRLAAVGGPRREGLAVARQRAPPRGLAPARLLLLHVQLHAVRVVGREVQRLQPHDLCQLTKRATGEHFVIAFQ